jgi:hypothetical protein
VTFLDSSASSGEPSAGSGEVPARPAVRVPARAVARDGSTSIVWRVRAGRVERVAVRVGAERSGEVEVLAGINSGDVVVVAPPAELAEGAAVEAAAP